MGLVILKLIGDFDKGSFSGIVGMEVSMDWVKRKWERGIGDSNKFF